MINLLLWIVCANPSEMVDRITSNYEKINLLYGKITRRCTVDTLKYRNVGKFYIKKPGKLFVRYSNPEKMISINDDKLLIYYPEENKAVKMNYNDLPDNEKQMLGIGTLLGFNPLHGLKKNFDFEMLDSTHILAKPAANANLQSTKTSKIIFEIDARRNIIMQRQVFDTSAKLVSQTDYKDWLLTDGVWLPQDIFSKTYSGTKEIKENTRFHELFVNYAIKDKQFNFTVPQGTKIVDKL